MGGVDRSDRMAQTYSVSRQSKKWWFRLFYYFLDTAIANSYILYHNSPNHPTITELEFVKNLSLALIGSASSPEKERQSFNSPKTSSWKSLAEEDNKEAEMPALLKAREQGTSNFVCL